MLDVSIATLRNWEERYGIVRPDRSAGGQRLFSRDQVEHLRLVKELLDAGLSPADAHRVLADQLETDRRPLRSASSGRMESPTVPSASPIEERVTEGRPN
ncbi:MAG: MerR family transcriptional regulator, light-induced transcriptional regulator [Chloroflexota bacterium]|nr:MerR family transcriptional regulator, light-induced transcriptional regulator [Chloroflexota bacterium]